MTVRAGVECRRLLSLVLAEGERDVVGTTGRLVHEPAQRDGLVVGFGRVAETLGRGIAGQSDGALLHLFFIFLR